MGLELKKVVKHKDKLNESIANAIIKLSKLYQPLDSQQSLSCSLTAKKYNSYNHDKGPGPIC